MQKIMMICDICGQKYQFGNHKYDGKYIPKYKLNVCMSCYEGNWDGWAPHYEQKFIEHLNQNGLPLPERNSKGWFPRD